MRNQHEAVNAEPVDVNPLFESLIWMLALFVNVAPEHRNAKAIPKNIQSKQATGRQMSEFALLKNFSIFSCFQPFASRCCNATQGNDRRHGIRRLPLEPRSFPCEKRNNWSRLRLPDRPSAMPLPERSCSTLQMLRRVARQKFPARKPRLAALL